MDYRTESILCLMDDASHFFSSIVGADYAKSAPFFVYTHCPVGGFDADDPGLCVSHPDAAHPVCVNHRATV